MRLDGSRLCRLNISTAASLPVLGAPGPACSPGPKACPALRRPPPRSCLQDAAGWRQTRSDCRRLSYRPAVGDGLAHLPGQGLGELRVGLSAERVVDRRNARRRATKAVMAKICSSSSRKSQSAWMSAGVALPPARGHSHKSPKYRQYDRKSYCCDPERGTMLRGPVASPSEDVSLWRWLLHIKDNRPRG
jgi:hypothetical protein